ncbi:hypothetical protein J4417_02060 [Candidatus Woesearchaeota archaeon]|nr:hypothetical protein [Candidatus Woesearchaeota archaeon]
MKLTAYKGKAIGLYSPREFREYMGRVKENGKIEIVSLSKRPRREDTDTTDVYRFKQEEVMLAYLHDWTVRYPYKNRVTINLYGQRERVHQIKQQLDTEAKDKRYTLEELLKRDFLEIDERVKLELANPSLQAYAPIRDSSGVWFPA